MDSGRGRYRRQHGIFCKTGTTRSSAVPEQGEHIVSVLRYTLGCNPDVRNPPIREGLLADIPVKDFLIRSLLMIVSFPRTGARGAPPSFMCSIVYGVDYRCSSSANPNNSPSNSPHKRRPKIVQLYHHIAPGNRKTDAAKGHNHTSNSDSTDHFVSLI